MTPRFGTTRARMFSFWIHIGGPVPNTPRKMRFGQQLLPHQVYTHTQAVARGTGNLQCPGSRLAPLRCCSSHHGLPFRGSTCLNFVTLNPLGGPAPKNPRENVFWATTFDSSAEHTHPGSGAGYWKFTMSRKPPAPERCCWRHPGFPFRGSTCPNIFSLYP